MSWFNRNTTKRRREKVQRDLERWAELEAELEDRTQALRDELEAISRPLQREIKTLETKIKKTVSKLQQSVSSDNAKVDFRKPTTRRVWDLDKLDGYAVAVPDIARFRTARPVKGSISIKAT